MIATVVAIITLAILVLVLFIVGEGLLLAENFLQVSSFDKLTKVTHTARCCHWSFSSEEPAQAAVLLDTPQL